ncbi:MAG: hypothetical protein COU07_01755 [Candidatus Harrisonbacteria bacterium CG10_big_fil_rev_8_21_14_0_10_40_38]|uniref:Translation elongation factor n=1 Tax=Candidatus Harrisonbacteria bacterium CG10_big_fil_rev_8_21_14_0_10_40_38 TaxID=1974583 RepID=A0A2H0UT55_9BACT|nr:MAG: hypothetical protein COU07_01755 [Candidatus Harrisonbacteria bacterium CG10_big_fil_rev_8_21_14_0_10_40_38]
MSNKTFNLWEQIFDAKKFDVGEDLHFITADEIKAITHAEPRIMAKMDSSADLPPIFKKHGYFLLPVKNGKYAIVRGDGFHRLEEGTGATANHVSRIKFPLTTAGRGSSEMQYLDYSFNSGALENVLGKQPLYQSIRGREYSRDFRFSVNKTLLEVSSVQLEVDSGLEGEDSIVLIEAKMDTPEDFIIRQLFYPYNHFKVISPDKTIVPVFFTYEPATKTYNFWIYEIPDAANYNSISLREMKSVRIASEHEIVIEDIKPKGIVAYKDLIPQANDVSKVIELVFKVSEGTDNYRDVAAYFEFDERQSSYYREAAEALGLVLPKDGKYHLTDVGKELVQLPAEKRNLFFAGLLADFNLVKNSLDILKEKGVLAQSDVEKVIARSSNLTGTTIGRRAGSMMSWLRWMAEATGSFSAEDGTFHLNK